MVLKSKAIAFIFLLAQTGFLFAQETDGGSYAASIISRVLKESPDGVIIRNKVDAADMSLSQQAKSWLPSVQVDFSADSKLVQGEYRYAKNGGVISAPQLITSPSAEIGISQRLPGNGCLSLGAGYSVSCLTGRGAYIQQPYIQLGLSQSLAPGAFFLTKDPALEMLGNQKDVLRMESDEAMFELAVRFISAVQDYDLALQEKEYYGAMLRKSDAEYEEQSHRHKSGQKNNIELFNSHMIHTQAIQGFQEASLKLSEAEAILCRYKICGIENQCGSFRDGISWLLGMTYGEESGQTAQELELLNEIMSEELSLKIDKSKLAPSLYMQATVAPEQSKNGEYRDLSRSLRDLADSPYAWTMDATVGVSLALDFASRGKTMREVSDKKIRNLSLQLNVLRDEQEKMRCLYRNWCVSFSAYSKQMELALNEEEEFRHDMRILFERNEITEAQYWATETSYYETRLSYYRSVWGMIQGKLGILKLSSGWMEFIKQFMEA